MFVMEGSDESLEWCADVLAKPSTKGEQQKQVNPVRSAPLIMCYLMTILRAIEAVEAWIVDKEVVKY